MTTGKRIRQVRKTAGITQSKFAVRIGISTSYVAEIELEKKNANDRIIRLVSVEFNVDEHWLKTGEGAMYHEKADMNLIKVSSLFKSLSPAYQEYVIGQLTALSNLYKSSIPAHQTIQRDTVGEE